MMACAIATVALLAGCISIYRMDVAQGNIVTPEMVSQLRAGMTRSQVRFVLGTPLVSDPFHPDRWDYFYSLHKGTDKSPDTRRLTVIFQDDELLKLEGDLATALKP
jgi:outer membrane protein assembly factor BamE